MQKGWLAHCRKTERFMHTLEAIFIAIYIAIYIDSYKTI